ncbi:MAG: OprO/OprP family phosphate-selective porin [Nevskiaceae bacterium]
MKTFTVAVAAAATFAAFGSSPAAAQTDLDERVKVIERKLEQEKATPVVSAGEKGFGFKSADGSFEFKFRGLLQADARFFADDQQTLVDTFLLRRLEPAFELSLNKFAFFRLQPQFAGDSATTSDVYGELRFHPAAALRFGKFKTPLGLEYLQGTPAMVFVERGLPTEVGAGRDVGVQLLGEVLAGTTTYAISFGNGTPDGRDAISSDTDNHKEVAARLFLEPLKNEPGFFRGLGFGIAMTQGTKLSPAPPAVAPAPGSSAFNAASANFNNTLPRYRSPGQATVFSYRTSTSAPTLATTVVAAGEHRRLSPQLYFYRGSFGLLAEQMSSEQEVSINNVADTFEHKAWQVAASYLLTGEDAFYKGTKPSTPYAVGAPGWGAFEVSVRAGELDIDDGVFPAYANPATAVSKVSTNGIALNWYVTGNARISLDYEDSSFDGGAAAGDRLDEKLLLTRLQVSF